MIRPDGFVNIFLCTECVVRETSVTACSCCDARLCPDLIAFNGYGKVVCFVCQGTAADLDEWPDWSYTLVPSSRMP